MPQPTALKPIPANQDQHLFDIAQIVSDQYAGGKYVKEISETYIGGCHYDFDTTRLIFDGDECLHHWGVWGYPMRVESIKLKVAGIGAVVTREPYRYQGLMASAANDSFEAMFKNGYDLSVLRGRHYVKFGYARAWNYVTTKLQPDEIPEVGNPPPYQRLAQEHLDEIYEQYNQTHEGLAGTAVRPTYQFISKDTGAYGWFDTHGRLAGYVRAIPTEDKNALQCLEAAGGPQEGLAVLKDLFAIGEYETLNFFTLHHHHPMLQIIRRGACSVEDRYFDNTGWRVKIINLPSTLEKLIPVLEARLQKSQWKDWAGEVHLDSGEQNANLKINNAKVQVAESGSEAHAIRGGAAIGRFLIGADEPQEIIQQEGIQFSGVGKDIVQTLFPNLYPMMSHWDEY